MCSTNVGTINVALALLGRTNRRYVCVAVRVLVFEAVDSARCDVRPAIISPLFFYTYWTWVTGADLSAWNAAMVFICPEQTGGMFALIIVCIWFLKLLAVFVRYSRVKSIIILPSLCVVIMEILDLFLIINKLNWRCDVCGWHYWPGHTNIQEVQSNVFRIGCVFESKMLIMFNVMYILCETLIFCENALRCF